MEISDISSDDGVFYIFVVNNIISFVFRIFIACALVEKLWLFPRFISNLVGVISLLWMPLIGIGLIEIWQDQSVKLQKNPLKYINTRWVDRKLFLLQRDHLMIGIFILICGLYTCKCLFYKKSSFTHSIAFIINYYFVV